MIESAGLHRGGRERNFVQYFVRVGFTGLEM